MTNSTEFAPPIGEPPAIQWLAIGRMAVDPSYQRSTDNRRSQQLITSIARKWDWRLCVPLLVAQRENGLFIIDGQHRWEGAKLRADIPFLPASVATYSSPADEAAIFVTANRARKTITNLEDFHAAVAAGDAQSIKIAQLVRAAGLSMAESTSPQAWGIGELGFTAGLRNALQREGEEAVAKALTLMGDAFRDQRLEHGGALFAAILLLGRRSDIGTTREAMLAMLRSRTAGGWSEHLVGLRGGKTRADVLRRAMAEALNAVAPAPIRTAKLQRGVTVDLSKVPSSMETRAAGWARR